MKTETLFMYIEQGGPPIMWTLVIMLALGIAIALWRLTIIGIALFNTKSLYRKVFEALQNNENGIEKAKEICGNTPGPVATIIHAGLSRIHKGLDHVEKAVESAGAVEMSFLGKGLTWLATISNLAPMLGFFGTVAGMIISFQRIAEMGDVEPTIVAGGISMALITTAGGLLVAMPIQALYNLCVYLIDEIITQMEENASKFIDLLVDLGYDAPGK